jgi:hypothetical protein
MQLVADPEIEPRFGGAYNRLKKILATGKTECTLSEALFSNHACAAAGAHRISPVLVREFRGPRYAENLLDRFASKQPCLFDDLQQ